ncbi:MAG: protein kinase domain-containing protein, partial [Acidimicrobiia bacterium]
MAVSVTILGLQAFVLRPRLWPAGEERPVAVIRPLEVDGSRDPEQALRLWRSKQRVESADSPYPATIQQPAIWALPEPPWNAWLRQHLGVLLQAAGFLTGAGVLLALGAHGTTATLMTLALIATASANSGPRLGAKTVVPILGPVLLFFNWLITGLSFPIIGLAVLYFPHRAEILDRQKWIVPAVIAGGLPMLAIGLVTASFLSGIDAALPALTWIATNGWVYDASFAIPLAFNVLIVVEGIARYRINLDADERRRIQIVVYTGVPAVFAYALKACLPIAFSLLGMPIELPWLIEAVLQAIVLLPAFGLPYAVAVKHVFSPRTVLRRSLQYAFARRTLTVLVALPVIALIGSLVQQRDMTIGMIVSGQPLFYLTSLAMLELALKYRDRAQRWLDQRFFRTEYDTREILVSLAGRVSYENDPRDLVAMVVTQIDSALHPECIAVLATDAANSHPTGRFEAVTALRIDAAPLRADSGVITLLRWSDKPLEVFLDDEQSPVARIPRPERLWLAGMNAALLVPIFAGGSDPRPFIGLIALGRKRSEEPYTAEDRELLRGIAVQMGVALDLSRLRRQVGTLLPVGASGAEAGATQAFTPTIVVGGGATGSAISVGALIDGKYRVDQVIGQGGMGAVFKAWDVRLERAVAIKVVRAELISDPDSRLRFRRESQIVARLQHPSIVTVFDYGHLADGAAFLVMEFVPGEDLRHFLKREGKLEASRMATLLHGIAGGVEIAHKSGIF